MSDAGEELGQGEVPKAGETIQLEIRAAPNQAYLVADSVTVVASNNAVEIAVLSNRVQLGHQLFRVVDGVEGGVTAAAGPILSGPDIVHVGSVRMSKDGLLQLVGLAVDHLRSVGVSEDRIMEKFGPEED